MKKTVRIAFIILVLPGLAGCSKKEPSVVKTYEVTDAELAEEYVENNKLVTMVKYYEIAVRAGSQNVFCARRRESRRMCESTFFFI